MVWNKQYKEQANKATNAAGKVETMASQHEQPLPSSPYNKKYTGKQLTQIAIR